MAKLLYSNDFYQVNLFYTNFKKKIKKWIKNNPFGLAWQLALIQPDRKCMGGPKKIICKYKIITNKRDLIENITKAWLNIHPLEQKAKNALSAVSALPQRIQNVIARKGGFTKY